MTLWKILKFNKTHLHKLKYVLSDVVNLWCKYGANLTMFRGRSRSPKFGDGSGSWSWCLPVSFRRCLGLQEGQILPSSKGFRQVGQKLTSLPFKMRWWIFCKLALKESHPREDYKELNQSLPNFSWWCRSCRSFLSSTMGGQSNLHSEVVLVPTPVQFDKQRKTVWRS